MHLEQPIEKFLNVNKLQWYYTYVGTYLGKQTA